MWCVMQGSKRCTATATSTAALDTGGLAKKQGYSHSKRRKEGQECRQNKKAPAGALKPSEGGRAAADDAQ